MFKIMRKKQCPIFFTKFEELKSDPRGQLIDIFKFLFNMADLSGTVIERRIDEVVQMGSKATVAYKLKKSHEFYEKSEDMFSKKQLNYILTELYDILEFFGYFKKKSDI